MSAEIQKLYIAYFNRPADPGGLTFWTKQLAAGVSMAQIANSFSASAEYQAIYNASTNFELVVKLYQNLFGRTPLAGEASWWSDQITPNGAVTITTIANQLASGTTAGSADNIAVTNKITAGLAYTAGINTTEQIIAYKGTAAFAKASAWLAPVKDAATLATAIAPATLNAAVADAVASGGAASGQIFTLTTGIDNFPGTSGNDTFQGDSANIGGLDRMSGGNGTDTLNLTSTAAAVTLSSNNVTGIEVINFTAGGANGAHTATLTGLTGITNVNNNGSSVGLLIGDGGTTNTLASLAALGISGTGQATTVIYQEAAVTGSSDAVTVTVSGVTGAAAVNVNTQTATATVAGAIETINVVSSGSTNSITLNTNDTQGLGAINVSGDQAITIALGNNAATDAIILNASTATGAVTITGIGAGNNFAGTAVGTTITGGNAGDTFTFTAGYIGAEATVASGTRDVINGGGGTDRLNIVSADAVTASTAAQVNLTSIEALTISDAISGTQAFDLTRFADVRALTLTAAVAANYTGSIALTTGTAVTLGASTVDNATVTFAVAGTSVTDTMTLNTAGFSFGGTGTETFTGIETLTINTGATAVATSVFADATTFTQSAGSTSSTITASGVNGLTFTGVITGVGTLDASALTGVLTVTAAAAAAITIRGGTVNDIITGSAAADLLTGGTGADTITGRAGNDSIDLTETTASIDRVVFSGGANNTATAANALTANGMDTITGFGATDVINIAALGDTAIGSATVTATLSAAAATSVFANDSIFIINTGATAAALTTGGTATVTDFTNMTSVAAFLSERFSHTASTADIAGVIVWNVGTTSYVYNFDSLNTANTTIDAAELVLVGTITQSAALVQANIVIT